MRLIRGRLAGVSVRASFGAGLWVGVTFGLVVGSLLGAVLAWSAGTILSWQRDLAFTLGVARTLLPLGDQVGALRWISSTWYLVIPATAVVFAVIAGLVGGLLAGLLAAAYNRSPRHAAVVVELADRSDEAISADDTRRTNAPRQDGTQRDGGGGRAALRPLGRSRADPMLPSRRPAAIIFDLDGTLVDTVGTRLDAWEATFAEFGIPVARTVLEPMIGMDGRRLAVEVASAAGAAIGVAAAEEIDRRAGELFDERNRAPRPLPGARERLAHLDASGVTWAIATSSRAEQVAASVAALGLDHRPRIVDGSEVEHAKPAPDLLLLAATRLGVGPERCWYVGDSIWDMRASVAAGMVGIGVLAGAVVGADALREAGAEVVLTTLDQLVTA